MGGVRGVDECEVYGFIGHWEFARIGVGDLFALGIEIEPDAFSSQVCADIEGGS